jgi:hypothetical protein
MHYHHSFHFQLKIPSLHILQFAFLLSDQYLHQDFFYIIIYWFSFEFVDHVLYKCIKKFNFSNKFLAPSSSIFYFLLCIKTWGPLVWQSFLKSNVHIGKR